MLPQSYYYAIVIVLFHELSALATYTRYGTAVPAIVVIVTAVVAFLKVPT
jgi:hypothetical protein